MNHISQSMGVAPGRPERARAPGSFIGSLMRRTLAISPDPIAPLFARSAPPCRRLGRLHKELPAWGLGPEINQHIVALTHHGKMQVRRAAAEHRDSNCQVSGFVRPQQVRAFAE